MFKNGVFVDPQSLPIWIATPKEVEGKIVGRSVAMNLYPGDEMVIPGSQSFVPVVLNGFDLGLAPRFETDELSPIKLVADPLLYNRYLVSSVALQYVGLTPQHKADYFLSELKKQGADTTSQPVIQQAKTMEDFCADNVLPLVTLRLELTGSWALNPNYEKAFGTFSGDLAEAQQHNYNVGVSPVHLVDALKILKGFGKSFKNESEVLDSITRHLPEAEKEKALNDLYGGKQKHNILRNVKNVLRDVSKMPAFKRK